MNQRTAFTPTAAKLAQKYTYPVIYIETKKIARGKYEVTPILLVADPAQLTIEEIITKYTQQLEKDIVSYPAGWLWSHRRWK